jgi:hypothetical protein
MVRARTKKGSGQPGLRPATELAGQGTGTPLPGGPVASIVKERLHRPDGSHPASLFDFLAESLGAGEDPTLGRQ